MLNALTNGAPSNQGAPRSFLGELAGKPQVTMAATFCRTHTLKAELCIAGFNRLLKSSFLLRTTASRPCGNTWKTNWC
jgi:hypothetical protein